MTEEQSTPEGEEEHRLLEKLEEIRQALVIKTSDDLADLLKLSRSTRRILFTNLLLGLARGVGFFIGISFLGALVVAFGYFLGGELADTVGASDEWNSFLSTMSGVSEMVEHERERSEKDKLASDAEAETPKEPEDPANREAD